MLQCQSLHPYLGIHLKNSNLVTGNVEQRSVRPSSLVKKKTQNAWGTDNGMNTVYLTCENSWGWRLTLRQPLVPPGKQQRPCCPFGSGLLWVLVESYPEAVSRCCAAAFRSLSLTESWEVEQVSRAPLPGEKSCVTADLLDVQLLLLPDLQRWLMLPNKFKASLFFVPWGSLWTRGGSQSCVVQ